MSGTVEIIWTCKECMVANRPLDVPERKVAVDIVLWVENTLFYVQQEHKRVSPNCKAKQVDVGLPMTRTDGSPVPMIGKQ